MELQGCKGNVDDTGFQAQAQGERVSCGSLVHNVSLAVELYGLLWSWQPGKCQASVLPPSFAQYTRSE
jgi:hypothetical protein